MQKYDSGHEFLVGTFYYKKDSYSAAIKRFQGARKFPEFKKRGRGPVSSGNVS